MPIMLPYAVTCAIHLIHVLVNFNLCFHSATHTRMVVPSEKYIIIMQLIEDIHVQYEHMNLHLEGSLVS